MDEPSVPLFRRLLPFLLAPVLLLCATPASRAADNGEWSVEPTASALGHRPYYYLSADPGTTLTDRVTVSNKTAQPLAFRLYAADAYNTERDGGFAVRTQQERQRGVGAWAKPQRTRITVPAHASVTVPYTLTVPETAEPGDHPGALVALDERLAAGSRGNVAVGVQRAVGARVYLRVTGPTVPALSVEDVTYSSDRPLVPGTGGSSAAIAYTLHNRGNVTLNPKVALRAEGLFGRTLLARDLTKIPSELLPRQKIRLTEHWAPAPQLDWGQVRLTASARDVRESGAVSFVAFPWLPAGVLLAVVAAVTARLWRKAGRGRRTGPRPPRRGTGAA
ncbi:WxL protein peptidoglycan domain-containing protein [Streptomyces sp. NPDC059169]|uniref:WxL protein peptidoglycan domain-containing protein n=1 Tax=unclassified Streptomyces TaxID=2593676 RepID=UPI0036B1728E